MPSLHDHDLEDLDDLDFLCEDEHENVSKERWKHVRIDWDSHVKKLLHEKHFTTEYRMNYSAFTFFWSDNTQRAERKSESQSR
mmetsp:Transcript_3212/g.5258  ORF Transcript_3212/g.5258 Transcript_3212/m.5258 type:complete len:83 (-) Transcript_3212:85-333(-)